MSVLDWKPRIVRCGLAYNPIRRWKQEDQEFKAPHSCVKRAARTGYPVIKINKQM